VLKARAMELATQRDQVGGASCALFALAVWWMCCGVVMAIASLTNI